MRRVVRRRLIIGAAIVMAALLAFIGVGLHGMYAGRGSARGRMVSLDVPSGASTRRIARMLQAGGVIGNAFWFRVYLAVSGQARYLQAGNYRFHGGETIPQAVAELRQGAVTFNTVSVTIPEGFTVRQIGSLLQRDGVCSDRAFMAAAVKGNFPQFWFVRMIPKNPLIRDRLEGYLFPNTYDFVRGESVSRVLVKILTETAQILSPALVARMKADHLTVAQTLTVGSLIEREAKLASDRPLIASVIFNRLHRHPPMPLQMDASIEYALGHTTTDLTAADLAIKSPYNTYTHMGLPPGPIANPGLPSIRAALYPAHTDYYYYVARFDGSGGNYYATTYAQQLANSARSQRNLARLQAGGQKAGGHKVVPGQPAKPGGARTHG